MGRSGKKKTAQSAPRYRIGGRFVSKDDWIAYNRSEAAKKGWETRKAKKAAKARKQGRKPTRKRLRGDDGRFVSKDTARRRAAARKGWETRKAREASRREAAAKAAATRREKSDEKRKRSEAAKLGWERRKARQAAEAKANRQYPDGPTQELKDLFLSPRWLDGSWHEFKDGTQEGQILVSAGGDPRATFLWLEKETAKVIRFEPVWVAIGVRADPPDDHQFDRYEELDGEIITLTYPRKSEFIGDLFLSAREIAANLMDHEFEITVLVIQVTYGERPERV